MPERYLVEHAIADTLAEVPEIEAVAIYGSWAKYELHDDSDIDLLILARSRIRWKRVRELLDPLQDLAGRDIYFAGYSVSDFWGKGISPYGFLNRILSGPLVPLIGDVRALRPEFRSKDHVPRVARDRGIVYGGHHRGIKYPK